MRYFTPALIGLLAFGACGSGASGEPSPSSTPAVGSSQGSAKSSGLISVDAKARCGGFGAAEAAQILGVAAATVTARSQDVTPTTRGCEFKSGDKAVSFSLTVEDSIDEAKKDFENLRETYVIAARAQESATGKALDEGAYSDILGVGDEGVWSVTNGSMAIRYRNPKIMVLAPNDKRMQAAVAAKIIEVL
jgi:hypothetical protein